MKKAFTLVELLIVITIIGVLVVALLPRLTGGRDKARDAARISHIQQLNSAFEILIDDYNKGVYPTFDGGDPSICLGRPEVIEKFEERLSTVPTEKLADHRWAGSGCDGSSYSEDGETYTNPTEGYDIIPTGTGYLMVAKLENPNATGEFIYDEQSLYDLFVLPAFSSQSTQTIISNLDACLAPGDCTAPLLIMAR